MPKSLERLTPVEAGREAVESGRPKVEELIDKAKELSGLRMGNEMLNVNVRDMAKKVSGLNPDAKVLKGLKGGKGKNWMGGADFGFRQMGEMGGKTKKEL